MRIGKRHDWDSGFDGSTSATWKTPSQVFMLCALFPPAAAFIAMPCLEYSAQSRIPYQTYWRYGFLGFVCGIVCWVGLFKALSGPEEQKQVPVELPKVRYVEKLDCPSCKRTIYVQKEVGPGTKIKCRCGVEHTY